MLFVNIFWNIRLKIGHEKLKVHLHKYIYISVNRDFYSSWGSCTKCQRLYQRALTPESDDHDDDFGCLTWLLCVEPRFQKPCPTYNTYMVYMIYMIYIYIYDIYRVCFFMFERRSQWVTLLYKRTDKWHVIIMKVSKCSLFVLPKDVWKKQQHAKNIKKSRAIHGHMLCSAQRWTFENESFYFFKGLLYIIEEQSQRCLNAGKDPSWRETKMQSNYRISRTMLLNAV